MDTITHGIAGALVGKAFFAGDDAPEAAATEGGPDGSLPLARAGRRDEGGARMAAWCAALGAVFPDSDSLFDVFDPTGMSVLTEHRGLTHSFVMLPLWALALAGVTRLLARRFGWRAPSAWRLALLWGAGIASHILLDLINSWGTMVWMPLDRTRVVWDLAFVIDFTLSAIVLAPQVAAWAYARREGSFTRRLASWVLFSAGAVGVERLAAATGFAFSPWVVVIVSAVAAALFFLPARRGWGFTVPRAAWCRAGLAALVLYLGLCFAAHRAALGRAEEFAARNGVSVERIAAIPLPPALTRWAGLIRAPQGVYASSFSLLDAAGPQFQFVADAEANGYVEAARRLPLVEDYLWFARFPVASYTAYGDVHIVEFTDRRFFPRSGRRTFPFTFRVTFDAQGRVMEVGWGQ
jgi:membrane-bound metal-dependent hydrolase YbcI (DUF457 family)